MASSIFATAGSTTATDFLEWHIESSAIFPECQGHTGNGVFVAAI